MCRIENTYAWDGTKRRRVVKEGAQTLSDECYYGDLVVENGQPLRILHAEGYVDVSGMPVFNYHLKDHLGNVRAVISSSYGPGAYTQTQASDYYPFGMAHTVEISSVKNGKAMEAVRVDPRETDESKTFTRSNAYLYNGKEEQPMPGKWLDYGARFYDPQLGRWHSVDPLADLRSWVTPYSYCQNSPIVRIDPNGALDHNYTVDDQGNTKLVEKTNDDFDVVYTKESWDNGTKDKSIKVDKGVLSSKKTDSGTSTDGQKYTFDMYTVKGDGKATELFEFMSTNTKVEWSQTLIGTAKDGKSILSTSHDKDTEAGQGYVFAYGWTIRGHKHSHPYSNIPSRSDKSWANTVNTNFANAKLQIFFKGNYFEYDKQGLIIVPTTLPEVNITPN